MIFAADSDKIKEQEITSDLKEILSLTEEEKKELLAMWRERKTRNGSTDKRTDHGSGCGRN